MAKPTTINPAYTLRIECVSPDAAAAGADGWLCTLLDEAGLDILRAYGSTPARALWLAEAMIVKSATGGGR